MRKKLIHLLLIIFITMLLSLAFYIIQLFYASSINGRSSRIYEQSLVASINQYEYLPALISEDEILRDVILGLEKDHLIYSQKLKFISEISGADAVYLMDINGDVKATSNYDSENNGFLYRNYSFRPYFHRAITEERKQFYYAKGATTGIPGFFISSPIIENKKIVGVAVVKLDMRHWERKWLESKENVVVVDENNVVILSSDDKWRYQTVGKLSDDVLARINEQQQFAGKKHSSLFSRSINLSFTNDDNKEKKDKAFWLIDKKFYLVNNFDISETGWKLYYLVKHDSILNSAIIFFIVISILSILAELNLKGRKRIIESNNKNRLLEIKRREELQTVMDNIHIGVVLFSNSGVLLSVNEHARNLLIEGESFSEDKPIHINQLLDIDHQNFDNILLEDIAAPAYHETNAIHEGKPSIPIMFAISKVSTIDREVYLMTVINITRRKVVEDELVTVNEHLEDLIADRTKELQETQTKLIQKNKAAALGNMAATIVHELSQPLTAMKSSIAAINAKINNSDWKGVVESADRLAPLNNKMNNVIKLLKFFSYQDRKSYESINIVKTINQLLENLKDTFQEKYILAQIESKHTELLINANPLKVDLIISNIIQNAIDALENTKEPKIIIGVKENNGWAEVVIEDNAGGVDTHIMEKMFSPYFTTKEVGKGLGLGLAITYEIIQEYSGTITVKNHNQGAQFIISLPLLEPYTQASIN
ncbi:MAG: C4-dicarboxylate-specific signal transduction histidine kinase [Cellvibrionaceae bacterium]|jgi:C4-dicarboxylate-specific signal transduction histidine kinase